MESAFYKLESNRRIIAILAHPDDEAIACGGLLAKTVNNGGEGFVYILTSNEERKLELEKSCQILGVGYKALPFREKEFGFSSFGGEFLSGIEKIIADFRPHVLVTHDQQYDYHVDHRKTAELVVPRIQSVAMGSQGKPWIVELVLAAEINNFFPQPDIIVDITDSYGIKQKSCNRRRWDGSYL